MKINKNLNSKAFKLINPPFLLKSALKDYLWGGSRLKDDFCKETSLSPLAEAWVCSTHPDGLSIAASAPFEGMSLTEVLAQNPEFLGSSHKGSVELPILIKLIDAKQNLSIQVHPNDEYAQKYENGSLGKDEMWYVLDAPKNAFIIYGFNREVSKKEVTDGVKNGGILKYLQKIEVHKNDVFFIKAGVIHAIGAGVLIAEVQQSSNLTYRLYDYDRIDKNGLKRQLHIKKALDVACLHSALEPVQPMRTLKFFRGIATDRLCRCKYFAAERFLLNTERIKELAEFYTGANTFQVLLCLDGCGAIFFEAETGLNLINFHKGDCVFFPANSCKAKLHGKATLLCVSC